MQFKRIAYLVAVLLATVAAGITTTSAKASSYLNGNSYARSATRHIKLTKTVRVYRVHTGKYEAANRFSNAGTLKKGKTAYISTNLMSTGGWVVRTGHFKANSRNFYLISSSNHSWYKKYRSTKKATHKAHELTLKNHTRQPVLYHAPAGKFIN